MNKSQAALLKMFRDEYLSTLKENISLKNELSRDCINDEQEYKLYVGGESDDHDDDNDYDDNEDDAETVVQSRSENSEVENDDNQDHDYVNVRVNEAEKLPPPDFTMLNDPLSHIETSDAGASTSTQ